MFSPKNELHLKKGEKLSLSLWWTVIVLYFLGNSIFICMPLCWMGVLSRSCKISSWNAQKNFFFEWGSAKPKTGNMSKTRSASKSLHVFRLCVSLWVYRCKPCLVHTFMCLILVHAKSQCCTGVAVLRRLSDMPVMGEIVRDFKVAESSSESASVFRQPGSGLPDKPLKTFNPVNSQCKSVCCTVLIHN